MGVYKMFLTNSKDELSSSEMITANIAIVVSLVIFFLFICLLIYWLSLPRKRQKKIMHTQRETYKENLKQSQIMQAQLQHQQQTTLIQELERLAQLKDNGNISEEEYNSLKKHLLNV